MISQANRALAAAGVHEKRQPHAVLLLQLLVAAYAKPGEVYATTSGCENDFSVYI
jgi:hypothetical protein